ncbi:MAG: hypothetical protein DWB56_17210 [Candidatus Jettenia sp.]|uniref:hypothetical protein n=1 Tax=Candidatus Jettenia sp. AMX1 TaxID=2293637 RepID=UPI00058D3499|nr:hypothetical protein [Candidatus Jettenia sp. AMX1]MBC6930655.1 hypothetical protein [Candidatus Jettenia sp.]GJQ45248.1 MAG: hypothetical protein JETCAE04_10020 [Candidatus Jettenia caeni]KAA0246357.1 MAG: hypothetical protein EDM77_16945 [Candidatus Jettenia sp. AMX1]MCE7882244.1 hypothetical protein [Candidatus Jettenia sp. AMX1]MCQ3928797.1 hypothetical protein [Candidatus Jettenia sp.]
MIDFLGGQSNLPGKNYQKRKEKICRGVTLLKFLLPGGLTIFLQVIFGMTVSGDGGVPLTGRITSGNTSDSTGNRFNLEALRQIVPDISESILVSDSKFFAAPTLEVSYEQGDFIRVSLRAERSSIRLFW